MAKATIYVKAERSAQAQSEDVFLKDVASVYCEDQAVQAKVNAIRLHRFKKDGPGRFIISITEVIALIMEAVPGAEVVSLGEPDTVVERIFVEKRKGWKQTFLIVMVSLVCFFGASFTIMAFHNDIGIVHLFGKFYYMVMGEESGGFTALEVSYSIGLSAGIIIFFNHIGRRRLTKDPTPIEVEMRIYEEDVEKALIATADREGLEIDVN